MSDSTCIMGVATVISSQMQPLTVKVTSVNEYTYNASEDEAHWALCLLSMCMLVQRSVKLNFMNAPQRTSSMSWGTSLQWRALKKLVVSCVGSHDSGTKNTNSSLLMKLARCRHLRTKEHLGSRCAFASKETLENFEQRLARNQNHYRALL